MKVKYYAIYAEHTLGYVYEVSGESHFGILHTSILKGSYLNGHSSTVHFKDDSTFRKATEQDFDDYRVYLPSDFHQLNN